MGMEEFLLEKLIEEVLNVSDHARANSLPVGVVKGSWQPIWARGFGRVE